MREAPETTGEPLTLHRHDTEGHLGGAVYSQPFAAYLGQALATHRAIDDGQHTDWWRNAYLTARLRAQMLTYPNGGRAYLAILAMERDGMTLATAAARCGKSDVWLRRMIVRLHILIAEYRRVGAQRRHRRILPSQPQHDNLSAKAS